MPVHSSPVEIGHRPMCSICPTNGLVAHARCVQGSSRACEIRSMRGVSSELRNVSLQLRNVSLESAIVLYFLFAIHVSPRKLHHTSDTPMQRACLTRSLGTRTTYLSTVYHSLARSLARSLGTRTGRSSHPRSGRTWKIPRSARRASGWVRVRIRRLPLPGLPLSDVAMRKQALSSTGCAPLLDVGNPGVGH